MLFRRLAVATLAVALPFALSAQAAEDLPGGVALELNALEDVGGVCRLTFLAQNRTGFAIDNAVFEAVIFDRSGGVMRLSLLDFRDLPADRLRVRQFDLPDISCNAIAKALINGASSCVVEGNESGICDAPLSLGSRTAVGLIG